MRWNACVHRLDLGFYSHPKEYLGSGVRTLVNSKGKNHLYRKKNLLRGGSNPRRCIKQDTKPNTLSTGRHSETEVAGQTHHLTQSQHIDTRAISPSTDPITPFAEWGQSPESSRRRRQGFVHPLQDVDLHQCLPLSSVFCFPNPGGSLLLCYVVLPSSAWSSS